MSVKLMSTAWDMDLPTGQKMLLLALCDHANDEGVCYPSQEKLARKCSMGERTVISHIQWLGKHGILSKERRQNTQRRKSDLYQITLDGYMPEPENPEPENPEPENPEPANFAPANFAPANSAPANSAPANSAPANFSPEPANFAPSEPANFAGTSKEEPSEFFNHQIEPSWGGGNVVAAPEAEILDAEILQAAKTEISDAEILDAAKPAEPSEPEPEPEILQAAKTVPAKPADGKTADEKIRANPDNVRTWNAYAAAYRRRYGILPESNAKTRGQVAQFVKLVGAEKAPLLAAYFPTHNGRWFVQCRHEFGLLLKAYQQVATDYATGQQMTETRARQAEGTQSNLESHNGALKILREYYGLD